MTLIEIHRMSVEQQEKLYNTYRRRLRDAQNRARKAGFRPRYDMPPTLKELRAREPVLFKSKKYANMRGTWAEGKPTFDLEFELKALSNVVESQRETVTAHRWRDKKRTETLARWGLDTLIGDYNARENFFDFLDYLCDMEPGEWDSYQFLRFTQDYQETIRAEGLFDDAENTNRLLELWNGYKNRVFKRA